jgi:hypothetical protein
MMLVWHISYCVVPSSTKYNIKQQRFGIDIICQLKHCAVQLTLHTRKFCNIRLFTTKMFKNAVAAVVV